MRATHVVLPEPLHACSLLLLSLRSLIRILSGSLRNTAPTKGGETKGSMGQHVSRESFSFDGEDEVVKYWRAGGVAGTRGGALATILLRQTTGSF